MFNHSIPSSIDQPWARKHDPIAHPVIERAPVTVYARTLEDLIGLCAALPPGQRLHAAGSHWSLSRAALSDSVFIETHDPSNERPGLSRTLREVVPGCLTSEYVDAKIAAAGTAAPDGLRYPMHFESGKRIYEAYAEFDFGDATVPESLAGLLRDSHHCQAYLGSWAFPTLGGAGGQTVVGAALTGTHGGDFDRPPLADGIIALHMVLDGGRHIWIERPPRPGHPQLTDDAKLQALYCDARYGGPEAFSISRDGDTFDAAIVSIGRFGVVYSIVFEAVPQYALHERRRLRTWQDIRQHVGDPGSSLFNEPEALPAGQRFLQVAVCLTPHGEQPQNLAGVTSRWNVPVLIPIDPDTGVPAGRRERRGDREPGSPADQPTFTNAGNSYPYTPDPNRPHRAGDPSLLLRAASSPDIVHGAVRAIITELESVLFGSNRDAGQLRAALPARHRNEMSAETKALRELVESLDATIAFHEPPRETLGQVLDHLRGSLLGRHHRRAPGLGLYVWRAVAYVLFKSQQDDLDYEALGFAVMDGHNYLDRSSNINVESVEVFFDATNPALVEFVDELIAFESAQEEQHGEAFVGYASLRFSGPSRALLGPQRAALTCAVEVSGLADLDGSSAVVEHAEQWALRRAGQCTLHWGQRNHATVDEVERMFGGVDATGSPSRLDRWRAVLSELTDGGRQDAFSSQFTRLAGLEVHASDSRAPI